MKKFGEFWIPDIDARWGKNRRKSKRLFERGQGPKVSDLEEGLSYCQRWTVALDGGANVGAYTRVLMQRFELVYAFEPAPDTFACLERNLAEWGGCGRVNIQQRPLSDRAEFLQVGGAGGRRSVSRRVMGRGEIPAVRIDDLELPDLAFLKLDLEGYEERGMRGAEATLRRFQPIVMFEDKPVKSAHFGDPGGAHRFLESIGMKPLACIGAKQIDWVYGFPT